MSNVSVRLFALSALLCSPALGAAVIARTPVAAPSVPGVSLPSVSPAMLGIAPLAMLPSLTPTALISSLTPSPSAPEIPHGAPGEAATPQRPEAAKLVALFSRSPAPPVADAASSARAFEAGSYLVKRKGEVLIAVSPRMAAAASEILKEVSAADLSAMPAEALEGFARRIMERLTGEVSRDYFGQTPASGLSPLARLGAALAPPSPRANPQASDPVPGPEAPKPTRVRTAALPWMKLFNASRVHATLSWGLAGGASIAAYETLSGGWTLTAAFAAAAAAALWLIGGMFRDSVLWRRAIKDHPLEEEAHEAVAGDSSVTALLCLGLLAMPAIGSVTTLVVSFASGLVLGDALRFGALGSLTLAAVFFALLAQWRRRGLRAAVLAETGVPLPWSLRASLSRLGALLLILFALLAVVVGPMPLRFPSLTPRAFDRGDRAAWTHLARPASTDFDGLKPVAPAPIVRPTSTDAELEAAVARGTSFLLSTQHRGGQWSVGPGAATPDWDSTSEALGITALVVETLEREAAASPAIAKGTSYLFGRMLSDRAQLVMDRLIIGDNNDTPYSLAFGLKTLLRGWERAQGDQKKDYAAAIDKTLQWMAFNDFRYISREEARGTFQLAVVLDSLASARAAGFHIPAPVRFSAVDPASRQDLIAVIADALIKSRRSDRTYPYSTQHHGEGAENWPRTALIEIALYRAGRSDKASLEKAVDDFIASVPDLQRVLAQPKLRTHDNEINGYAKYYFFLDIRAAASALRELNGAGVKEKAAAMRALLLGLQGPDGSWTDSAQACGPSYGTAMAIQTLRILQDIIDRR